MSTDTRALVRRAQEVMQESQAILTRAPAVLRAARLRAVSQVPEPLATGDTFPVSTAAPQPQPARPLHEPAALVDLAHQQITVMQDAFRFAARSPALVRDLGMTLDQHGTFPASVPVPGLLGALYRAAPVSAPVPRATVPEPPVDRPLSKAETLAAQLTRGAWLVLNAPNPQRLKLEHVADALSIGRRTLKRRVLQYPGLWMTIKRQVLQEYRTK